MKVTVHEKSGISVTTSVVAVLVGEGPGLLAQEDEGAEEAKPPPPKVEANGVVKKTTLRSEDQTFKDQQADRLVFL